MNQFQQYLLASLAGQQLEKMADADPNYACKYHGICSADEGRTVSQPAKPACGCGGDDRAAIVEEVLRRLDGGAALSGQSFGTPDRRRYTAAVVGPRRAPGKGGIITSERLTIPASAGLSGPWTAQIQFSADAERVLSGQEICDLSVLGIEDPMYASQIYLTLRVNGRDDFGGIVDFPLNRMIGNIFDPQNRIRLTADPGQPRGAISGGPILPSDTVLVGHVYVPQGVTFDDDLHMQLQVAAGICA